MSDNIIDFAAYRQKRLYGVDRLTDDELERIELECGVVPIRIRLAELERGLCRIVVLGLGLATTDELESKTLDELRELREAALQNARRPKDSRPASPPQ